MNTNEAVKVQVINDEIEIEELQVNIYLIFMIYATIAKNK